MRKLGVMDKHLDLAMPETLEMCYIAKSSTFFFFELV